ncbi:tetratricopeptide repeat protein [Nocardia tengchongensis]|uniref:Tetratricopeptide repeat protein n=1 Tax=Nocardia tengchongensis TaxID=2055889 RepID=A0ABX8CVB1_9NOCA|nr:tetratricopeptide repeat protein [Nocardia tengchongensis]QVI22839.1 tetratricopeptide repeat protein [Nocardia tengchongensis]
MSEKIEKARVLADLGRYDGAREMLGEVLASEPEHPVALAEMASLAYREGEYGRALEFAGAALRVSPDEVFVWRVRALAELQAARGLSGDAAVEGRGRAVAAARRAVELEPEDADNLRILAATQRDTDPAAALANLDLALELDPDDTHAHLLRGLTLRRNVHGPEALAQAEDAFREVLRLEPENAEALYELAGIALDRGDREAGAEQLRRVAQLDPDYGDAVREQLAWLAEQDALRARAAQQATAVGGAANPYVKRKVVAPVPVPVPSSGGGSRFGRWIAAIVVLAVIRLGVAAMGADHDSAPATTHHTPPLYTAPPTFTSYLRQYPLTVPPMPSWLEHPPTYIPPPNFPTYRPPAPR